MEPDDDNSNYGDEFDTSLSDADQKIGVVKIEEKNPRRLLGSEELGPVTKRFVIVRRGMDVVLECHDAVGNEDVQWEKQGGNLRRETKFIIYVWLGQEPYSHSNLSKFIHFYVT